MVGWHHGLNSHEFEQTLGDSKGQGSLECCSPWGHIEFDMGVNQKGDCPGRPDLTSESKKPFLKAEIWGCEV